MKNQNWQEIKRLFHQTIELSSEARRDYLAKNCQDENIRHEVEELLAFHKNDNKLINESAIIDAGFVAEKADFIGKQIGHYEILREIGRGGMGVVYEAVRHDDFEQKVAVKIIKRGMDTDFILQRFQNERQILASLNHPNIARLLDGGTTDDGLPYFVMELIEGEPLLKFCDSSFYDVEKRLKLFREICSAVSYAHQNLIVHRDLKPSNISITKEGTPKLLDFGIAKIINPESDESTAQTDDFARIFTPEYASPEQIRGERISTSSDVYSLGVILYELLSGHNPFRRKNQTPHEWMQVICETIPEKPSDAATNGQWDGETAQEKDEETNPKSKTKNQKSLKGDLDNIILKSLQKDSQRRYLSVQELSEDIRRHLVGLPVTAQADTFGYRASKFVKRHRAGVLASSLIALALIFGISATAWQAHQANLERAKAEAHFNQVRKLANTILFEYQDNVAKLAGSTALREKMVKDSLEYLDNLSAEGGNDLALQAELATAYEKVGDVQGNPFNGNTGDQDAALASYQKAMAIRENLYAVSPSDTEIQRKLAFNYKYVGDVFFVKGANNEAISTLQKGLQLYDKLTTDDPSNIQDRFAWLSIQDDIARVQQQSGDLSNALATFRQVLAEVESMESKDPTNFRFRRGVAISQTTVGDILLFSHNFQAALDLHRKAAARFSELSNEDSSNLEIKRNLALLYIRIADENRELKNYKESVETNHRALNLLKELDNDPQNVQNSFELADVYANLSQVLGEMGNLSEAKENNHIALKLFEELLQKSPNHTQGRSDFGNTYVMFGDILAKNGDFDSALENYRKGLAIIEVEPMRSMGDPNRLAKTYQEMGDAEINIAEKNKGQLQTEHLKSAEHFYQQSLDAWQDLQKQNKLSADETNNPDKVKQNLEKCEKALAKIQK